MFIQLVATWFRLLKKKSKLKLLLPKDFIPTLALIESMNFWHDVDTVDISIWYIKQFKLFVLREKRSFSSVYY